MNKALWVLQFLFGLYFIAVAVIHFVVPEGLPSQMSWMYDLSETLHALAGAAEILGGVGLILPALTRIRPELTAYAAFGLALVMVGAAVWHLGREEVLQIGLNLVNAALLVFIGYGRLRLVPIQDHSARA